MAMKKHTILYDNIITKDDDEDEFNHGHVVYEHYKTGKGIKLLSTQIDLHLAILPQVREKFIEELTELIDRYAE